MLTTPTGEKVAVSLFYLRGEFETQNLPRPNRQEILNTLMEVCTHCRFFTTCRPSHETTYENSIVIKGDEYGSTCWYKNNAVGTR